MPAMKKYMKKRSTRPRRRPQGMFSKNADSVQIATAKETFIIDFPTNTGTRLAPVDLAASTDRVLRLAQSYQQYRIKDIKVVWKPLFDTYTVAAGAVVPQLHYLVDKLNSIPTGFNLAVLKECGAKPIRFDDKNITKTFKPSVVQANYDITGANVASGYKLSPWLSTSRSVAGPFSPSTIGHYGLLWQVDCPGTALTLQAEFVVQWEFRKPLDSTITPGSTEALVSRTGMKMIDTSGNVVA